jgi:hypothetical protein
VNDGSKEMNTEESGLACIVHANFNTFGRKTEKEREPLKRPGRGLEDNKRDVKGNRMGGCRRGSSLPEVSSCEHGNELSGFTNAGKFVVS